MGYLGDFTVSIEWWEVKTQDFRRDIWLRICVSRRIVVNFDLKNSSTVPVQVQVYTFIGITFVVTKLSADEHSFATVHTHCQEFTRKTRPAWEYPRSNSWQGPDQRSFALSGAKCPRLCSRWRPSNPRWLAANSRSNTDWCSPLWMGWVGGNYGER